jgi:hypothetical protein
VHENYPTALLQLPYFSFLHGTGLCRKPDAGDGERPKNISFQPLAILPKKSASWIYDGKKWLK